MPKELPNSDNNKNNCRSEPIEIHESESRSNQASPTSPSLRQMSGGIESMHFYERMFNGNSDLVTELNRTLSPSARSNSQLTLNTTNTTTKKNDTNSTGSDIDSDPEIDQNADINITGVNRAFTPDIEFPFGPPDSF